MEVDRISTDAADIHGKRRLVKFSWLLMIPFLILSGQTLFAQTDSVEVTVRLDSVSVVKGKIPVFYHKADTVIFNASGVKSMEYDKLQNLLTKFPGMSFRDGKFYVNGEEVKKILLNGELIFGNDTSAPMDLILAKTVKQIRSFREHDRARLLEADTLGLKQRVVDVITYEPMESVSMISLEAGAGAAQSEQLLSSGEASAALQSFKNRRPGISGKIDYNHNTNSSSPIDKLSFNGTVQETQRRNKQYSFVLDGFVSDSRTISGYEEQYSLLDRRMSSEQSNRNRARMVSASGMFGKSLSDNTSLYFDGKGFISWGNSLFNQTKNISGSIESMSDQTTDKSNIEYSLTGRTRLKHFLSKEKTKSIELNLDGSVNHGKTAGEIADTSASATNRRWLEYSDKITSQSASLSARYYSTLIRNRLSYDVTGMVLYSRSRQYSPWNSLLDNRKLTASSIDADYDTMTERGYANLIFRNSWLHLALGADLSNYSMTINDSFHGIERNTVRFLHLSPYLKAEAHNHALSMDLSYLERVSYPEYSYLLPAVNVNSQYQYYSGSPDLKIPVSRQARLKLSYNSYSIGTVWNLSGSISHIANPIVTDIRNILTDTCLEEYGLSLPAGSQLIRYTNGSSIPNYSIEASADVDIVDVLKITPVLSWNSSGASYCIESVPYVNRDEGLKGSLSVRTIFSTKFSLLAQVSYAVNKATCTDTYLYSSSNLSSSGDIVWYLTDKLVLNTRLLWTRLTNDSELPGFNDTFFDLSMDYHLGKKNDIVLFLKGSDLLNSAASHNMEVIDQVTRLSYNTNIGRAVLIGIRLNIR